MKEVKFTQLFTALMVIACCCLAGDRLASATDDKYNLPVYISVSNPDRVKSVTVTYTIIEAGISRVYRFQDGSPQLTVSKSEMLDGDLFGKALNFSVKAVGEKHTLTGRVGYEGSTHQIIEQFTDTTKIQVKLKLLPQIK